MDDETIMRSEAWKTNPGMSLKAWKEMHQWVVKVEQRLEREAKKVENADEGRCD
ncbi:hypothetical protein [Paenibacillus cremeus]|uniref:hypothetical protein n=1 Tax=Paenibacillus cremeus TaxID=2163881 RepID=UPI0016487A7E|nr:hypothetical protein [Paenibacillus cremeus]